MLIWMYHDSQSFSVFVQFIGGLLHVLLVSKNDALIKLVVFFFTFCVRNVVDFVLEVVLSRRLLCQSRLPQSIRVNLATAVQASLLYASATWPALSATQQRKLAVRCYNPLRKAVNGAWSVDHQRRPMCWDEILAWSKRPSFQVAMSVARLRVLVRIKYALQP